MKPEDVEEGDQFVRESDGFVFWTATGRAHEPSGEWTAVPVRFHDGGRDLRFLPTGRELPIRRPGVSS